MPSDASGLRCGCGAPQAPNGRDFRKKAQKGDVAAFLIGGNADGSFWSLSPGC
jgi:hypothetical protein